MAAGDVDNGKAAETEGRPGIAIVTGIIGAAVANGVRHALDDRGGVGRLNSYESCDSTHERSGDLFLTLPWVKTAAAGTSLVDLVCVILRRFWLDKKFHCSNI
jgi:hypothetical protein